MKVTTATIKITMNKNNHPLLINNHNVPVVTASMTTNDISILDKHHKAASSSNSRAAYSQDLKSWKCWCQEYRVCPESPEDGDICLWLSHMAEDGAPNRLKTKNDELVITRSQALAIKTIERRLSTVRQFLRSKQCHVADSMVVKNHLRGIRKVHQHKRLQRAKAMTPTILETVIQAISCDSYKDFRDKALLLLGFSGALRVSDLSGITPESIKHHYGNRGVILTFGTRKAKAELSRIEIYKANNHLLCPVQAIEDLLLKFPKLISDQTQCIFRGTSRHGQPTNTGLKPDTIARIIKARAKTAGFAIGNGQLQGHSLRRGYIDTALMAGHSIAEVMKTSGHSDPKTLMMYLDELGEFKGQSLL